MKSSSGEHYVALDHVRAFAAFFVFTWHFNHNWNGVPVAFASAPAIFPLALLDEGHTGVSLFMTLSGYLFAKLLSGKDISYVGFFWNRFIRLAPLLLIVFVLAWIDRFVFGPNETFTHYLMSLLKGVVMPTWPNGGWSITIEIQFYVALLVLLAMTRRFRWAPLAVVVIMIIVRAVIFESGGDVRYYSYWTIAGRADDFLLGIAAFNYRSVFERKHMLAAFVFLAFCGVWWVFDFSGGYDLMKPRWPWIILPTIEGTSYSILIAYYDASFRPARTGISKFLSLIGTYSYSIYLLHFSSCFERLTSSASGSISRISMYRACSQQPCSA